MSFLSAAGAGLASRYYGRRFIISVCFIFQKWFYEMFYLWFWLCLALLSLRQAGSADKSCVHLCLFLDYVGIKC